MASMTQLPNELTDRIRDFSAYDVTVPKNLRLATRRFSRIVQYIFRTLTLY